MNFKFKRSSCAGPGNPTRAGRVGEATPGIGKAAFMKTATALVRRQEGTDPNLYGVEGENMLKKHIRFTDETLHSDIQRQV